MTKQGRQALAAAVRRHREHHGWSREEMAEMGLEMLRAESADPDRVRFSPSTIKNVETTTKDVSGRTAGVIERLFEWKSGTVAAINAGEPAPSPVEPSQPETPASEDDSAFATFRTWDKEVQELAMFVGGSLAWRSKAERARFKRELYKLFLPDFNG